MVINIKENKSVDKIGNMNIQRINKQGKYVKKRFKGLRYCLRIFLICKIGNFSCYDKLLEHQLKGLGMLYIGFYKSCK